MGRSVTCHVLFNTAIIKWEHLQSFKTSLSTIYRGYYGPVNVNFTTQLDPMSTGKVFFSEKYFTKYLRIPMYSVRSWKCLSQQRKRLHSQWEAHWGKIIPNIQTGPGWYIGNCLYITTTHSPLTTQATHVTLRHTHVPIYFSLLAHAHSQLEVTSSCFLLRANHRR